MNTSLRFPIFLLFCICTAISHASLNPFHRIAKGVLPIYQDEEEHFFEVPVRLYGRDFLLSARVVELTSENNKPKLTAGQRLYDPIVVYFVEQEGELLLQQRNAKKKKEVLPTRFAIEQRSDSSVFIRITSFFKDYLPEVEPFNQRTAPGQLLAENTKIVSAKSYDRNVEIKVRYVYQTEEQPFVTLIQKSLLLLEEEMMPRISNPRMGYYTVDNIDTLSGNDAPQKVKYINRFHIRPKPADVKRYLKGKTVDPQKQLVFYVDTLFPAHWREAIKAGIEDWNVAFRAIGFNRVMVAKDYPACAAFDANDIRFNCFRYVQSDRPNAMGARTTDPRTGEIVQADVFFYSTLPELLQRWFFLQTAAVNPEARQAVLSDATWKRLLRYAAAHEVGHCLGLTHNFRASFAYDTKMLRDARFTQTYGTTPSIMDYARFNYIAQPGDEGVSLYPPFIGVYDVFSIKKGYQWLNVANEYEDEKTVLAWLKEVEDDPMFIFAGLIKGAISTEPSRQSADLGNNPVASSAYGLKNLMFILEHLNAWTPDSVLFEKRYKDIFNESFNYINKVIPLIGGVYIYEPLEYDSDARKEFVPKEQTTQAIRFVMKTLFELDTLFQAAGETFNLKPELYKKQCGIIDRLLHPAFITHLTTYAGHPEMIGVDEYTNLLTSEFYTYNQKGSEPAVYFEKKLAAWRELKLRAFTFSLIE